MLRWVRNFFLGFRLVLKVFHLEKFRNLFFSQNTGSQESIIQLDLDDDDESDVSPADQRRRYSVSPMPQIRSSESQVGGIQESFASFLISVSPTDFRPVVARVRRAGRPQRSTTRLGADPQAKQRRHALHDVRWQKQERRLLRLRQLAGEVQHQVPRV